MQVGVHRKNVLFSLDL